MEQPNTRGTRGTRSAHAALMATHVLSRSRHVLEKTTRTSGRENRDNTNARTCEATGGGDVEHQVSCKVSSANFISTLDALSQSVCCVSLCLSRGLTQCEVASRTVRTTETKAAPPTSSEELVPRRVSGGCCDAR